MATDEFGDLSADMMDEFDLNVEEASAPKGKVAKAVDGVSRLLKATGKGAMRGVKREVEDRFTNTRELINEAILTVDDFKKLREDFSSEMTPAINTMKQITLRVMPMAQNFIPKKFYDGLTKKLSESLPSREMSSEEREQNYREDAVSTAIRDVFTGQLEIQKHYATKEEADRAIDRELRNVQFKAQHRILSNVDMNVQNIANFLNGTYTGYLKKSLELKYQGMFVMRDIHKAVVTLAKITENRLEEIKHNTSLPDLSKQMSLRSGAFASTAGGRPQGYGEYTSTFRSKLIDNIRNSVLGQLKEVTRGILPGLDMATSMMQGMGSGKKFDWFDAAGMALGKGAEIFARGKANKYLDKNEGLKDLIENKAQFAKQKGIGMVTRWADQHRGKGTLLSMLADLVPQFNRANVRNTMLEGMNEAVPFDNTTRQTIVEVIPRHFERIGDLLEGLTGALAPNAKIERKTFNIHQRRLTTFDEAREDFLSRDIGSAESRAERMEDTMSTFRSVFLSNQGLKKTGKVTERRLAQLKEEEDDLKRFVVNSAYTAQLFRPDAIYEFVQSQGVGNDYTSKVFEGIKDPLKLAQTLCSLFLRKDGTINTMMSDRISNAIALRMADTNPQEWLSKVGENFGQSQLFTDVATHKEGVKTKGLFDVLNPQVESKTKTYFNPKTGKAYTDKELQKKGIDLRTNAEWSRDYQYDNLERLKAEEVRLEEEWKRSGGKEGDAADWLNKAGLGSAAYALPSTVNKALTAIAELIGTAGKKTGSFLERTFVGEDGTDKTLLQKGVDKMQRDRAKEVNKLPEIKEIARTGSNTYDITAFDRKMNKLTAKITSASVLPEGVLPVAEIQQLCRKKKWRFNQGSSELSYFEYGSAAPVIPSEEPEHSPYSISARLGGSFTIGEVKSPPPAKPKVEYPKSTRESEINATPVDFDWGTRTTINLDIPDKLDEIIRLLGGKMTNASAAALGRTTIGFGTGGGSPTARIGFNAYASAAEGTPVATQPSIGFGMATSTVTGGAEEQPRRRMGFDAILEDNTAIAAQTPETKEQDKGIKAVAKKVKERIEDMTETVTNTFATKEAFLQYIPEEYKEQAGKIYDESSKRKQKLSVFLNKVGASIKASPTQKKILDSLKHASAAIPDAQKRQEYVGAVLNKVSHYKAVMGDKEKRDKFLNELKDDMSSKFSAIRKEYEEKGLKTMVKDHTQGGIKGLMRQAKVRWKLFKRSKVGKWIMAHIPEEAKRDVYEAFQKAKGDIKAGIEGAKKVLNKHNEKNPEETIDPRILDATQIHGSGDEGEYTPADIAKSAIPEAAKLGVEDTSWFSRLRDKFKRQPKIDQRVLDATSSRGSGDEGEYTADDIFNTYRNDLAKQETVDTRSRRGLSRLFKFFKRQPQQGSDDPNSRTTSVPESMPGTVKSTKPTSSRIAGSDVLGGIDFEGDPDSNFHRDFRLFAARQLGDNQMIAASMGGGGGSLLGGLLKGAGGLARGAGNIGKGLLGMYGRVLGAGIGAAGNVGKGLLYAGGKILPSLISGGSRVLAGTIKGVGSAYGGIAKGLLTGVPYLAKKTWGGAKWAGGKLRDGYGYIRDKFRGATPEGEEEGEARPGMMTRAKNWFTGLFSRSSKPKFVDIYEKDKVEPGNPLLSVKQQEDGAFYEDKSPVVDSYSIKKPVFISGDGDQPRCVITKEQIEHGLVDINGKSLSSGGESKAKSFMEGKGWGNLFSGAWTGIKNVFGGIRDFFSGGGRGEGAEQVPMLGRQMGIDLVLHRLADIHSILKEDQDMRKQKAAEEAEAKKAALAKERADASLSAQEQQDAINAKLEAQKAENAADKAEGGTPEAVSGVAAAAGGGGGGGEEGGLMDDAMDMAGDALKSKAIRFARNKIAARGLKLLRKTKWGKRLLRSKVGKWGLKGMNKLLKKPKVLGKVAQAAGKLGKFGKLARFGGTALKGAGGMLGKGVSFLGKAAPWAALAGVGIGGVKGFTASAQEDRKYAEELGNENVFWRSIKTALNPIRQGRIIASTVRNTVGLVGDLIGAKQSEMGAKRASNTLDDKRLAMLKERGASEDDLKRYEKLAGDISNEALIEKNKIWLKYAKPVEPEPTPADKATAGTPAVTQTEGSTPVAQTSGSTQAKIVGGTLVPVDGESREAYDARLDTLIKAGKDVKSFFTKTGRGSYNGAIRAAEAMGNTPSDPVVPWNDGDENTKVYQGVKSTKPETPTETAKPAESAPPVDASKQAAAGTPAPTQTGSGSIPPAPSSVRAKVVGQTLVPVDGESREDYDARLAALNKSGSMKVNSFFTEEGRNNYNAAIQMAKAMGNQTSDSEVPWTPGDENTKVYQGVKSTRPETPADTAHVKGTTPAAGGIPAESIKATKPSDTVMTKTDVDDKTIVSSDKKMQILQEETKAKEAASKNAMDPNSVALVEATNTNNNIAQHQANKLDELVELMKTQITVTADSKEAQKHAINEASAATLAASVNHTNNVANQIKPKPVPPPPQPPAIPVGKPVFA